MEQYAAIVMDTAVNGALGGQGGGGRKIKSALLLAVAALISSWDHFIIIIFPFEFFHVSI